MANVGKCNVEITGVLEVSYHKPRNRKFDGIDNILSNIGLT